MDLISYEINVKSFFRFPCYPKKGIMQDYIEINIRKFLKRYDERIFWLFKGPILIKKTRYDYPKNGCNFRDEIIGKPEFQFSYLNLDKIRQCNEMSKNNMSKIKRIIDKCEKKLIESQMNSLINRFDISFNE